MLQFTCRPPCVGHVPLVLTVVTQLLVVGHAGALQEEPERGVIVEKVAPGSDGEKAGIRPGDVLISWIRAASPPANPVEARGDISSSFDLMAVETEQRPRGPVTITGTRDGREFAAVMPLDDWLITARPVMSAALLATYHEGRKLADANDVENAAKHWLAAASKAKAAGDSTFAVWLSIRAAYLLGSRDQGVAAYATATAMASDSPALTAAVLEAKTRTAYEQGDRAAALAALNEALRIRERLEGHELRVATTLRDLGSVTFDPKNMDAAESFWRRALTITEKEAPDSVPLARMLTILGDVESKRSKLPEAEANLKRALALLDGLAPDTRLLADAATTLGVVAHDRGDMTNAELLNRRALSVLERLAPDSLDVAWSLHNLGDIAFHQGELALADEWQTRALEIRQRLAPESRDFAASLSSLALLAIERGQYDAADHLLTRSLAINEKLGRDNPEVALTLNSLGMVRTARGDLTGAEQLFRRAIAIGETLAPASFSVALTHNYLAIALRRGGDLDAAERTARRALGIHGELGAQGLGFALTLRTLATVAQDRGNLIEAEKQYDAALDILRQVAPGSTAEAESLHGLAVVNRKAGRLERAVGFFEKALDALEAQTYKIGASEEIRSGFAASYVDYYRDYIDTLLDLKRPAQAFHVLERSRARSLLRMLAERPLVAKNIGSDLGEQRKQLDADYDRTQARLAVLSPGKDQAEIDRALARLRDLAAKREATMQRIRRESPRFATLQYPQPLDVSRTQSALDPGTVLLAYSVGKDKTFLFVVQPAARLLRSAPAVSVLTLPIGEAALRTHVTDFRSEIQKPALSNTRSPAPPITEGQRLFSLLITPASAFVSAADRVLISSDGPLHSLPFAALVQPDSAELNSTRPRYLVELKPLHTVISATVYAELKRTRRAPSREGRILLAAFGDPDYGGRVDQAIEPLAMASPVRTIAQRASTLDPLPASRTEVNAIAALYGDRAARYLGAEATEGRAKALGKDVRHVHFATHGLIDERLPLNSGIALTTPKNLTDSQDNGVLQAWEIIEHLQLDADLVTLSACDTALGAERGGEGLVGLTRAFHYAGARSVLASLWSVADDSTAELMTSFYRYLSIGTSKDASLRAAQLDLIRSDRVSHPFHWAAFTLSGDWR